MHAVFSEWLVEPRRQVLRTVLRRAVERGELREDADLELLIDMLVGPVIYRFIDHGRRHERRGRLRAAGARRRAEGLQPTT